MSTLPSKELITIDNPYPDRDYRVHIESLEFTCLCPVTGQPDFADIAIDYVPGPKCVELKSLKLYLWSFRDEGAFHEAVVNRMLDDLVAALSPRSMVISGAFKVRGGLTTTVKVRYQSK